MLYGFFSFTPIHILKPMTTQILLPSSIKRELREAHNASRIELDRALKFQINSTRAKELRTAAYDRGGLDYQLK